MRRHALFVALTVALAACASGEEPAASQTDEASPTATAEEGADVSSDDAGVQVSGELDAKPSITVPGGEPPTELVVHDIAEGDGEAVEPGGTVTTHYVGVFWDGGEQFDASWDRGEPIQFGLDQVIAGWQEGIPGMQVGGRRLLVIPPEQAYGDTPPPGIPPGSTLVFVIDLISTP